MKITEKEGFLYLHLSSFLFKNEEFVKESILS